MKFGNVTLMVFLFTAACSSGGKEPANRNGSDGDGGAASGAAGSNPTGGQGGNVNGGQGGNVNGGQGGNVNGGQQASGGSGGIAVSNGGGGGSAQTGGQAGGSENCSAAAPTSNLKLRFVASAQTMLDGQNVAAWRDQVSQVQATQADASRRPSVRNNAINGKAVIRFDGENDFLSFVFPVTGKDKMSVVTIGRTWQFQRGGENADCDFDKDGITDIGRELNCSGTDQTFLTWNEGGGGFKSTGIFLGLGQQEATFRFGNGRDYRFFKTPFVLDKPVNDAFVWSAAVMDGVWRTLYINNEIPRGRTNYRDAALHELRTRADQNAQGATQAGWTGAIGDTESTAWLGRGRFGENTSFWAGEIAELLIYEAALSDADRAQVGRYVKCTYGL